MLTGLRLYGAIGIAVALAIFIGFALHWKHQAADRAEKLALICQTTRLASANPKLACGQVAVQITEMGTSLKNVTAALDKQNAAVDAMGAKTVEQQAEAAKAVLNAAGRARSAEASAERLRASARSDGAPAGSVAACKPSKTLEGAWR